MVQDWSDSGVEKKMEALCRRERSVLASARSPDPVGKSKGPCRRAICGSAYLSAGVWFFCLIYLNLHALETRLSASYKACGCVADHVAVVGEEDLVACNRSKIWSPFYYIELSHLYTQDHCRARSPCKVDGSNNDNGLVVSCLDQNRNIIGQPFPSFDQLAHLCEPPACSFVPNLSLDAEEMA